MPPPPPPQSSQVISGNNGSSHRDGGPPSRPVGFTDVPMGPRNTLPQTSARDQDTPSRLSGRPSRFEPIAQPSSTNSVPHERDAMDMDRPMPPRQPRGDDLPRVPNMYPNRVQGAEAPPSGTPRAPKAMSSRYPDATSSQHSEARPPVQSPSAPPNSRSGRAVPPHLLQGRDEPRRVETLPSRSNVNNVPDGLSRRSDGHGPDHPTSRRDPLTLVIRPPFRHVDVPPPPRTKLSGSNSTPVGVRRPVPNGLPLPEAPRHSRSPVETYRPLPDEGHNYYERAAGKYPDEQPHRPSPRESPDSQYRALPAIERRQSFPSSAPPPPMDPPRRDRPSESKSRQTRFGPPEQAKGAVSEQARVWLTREESERMAAAQQSSTSRDPSLSSRHESMDVDEPLPRRFDDPARTDLGPLTPLPHSDSDRYERRPSLEGRLSSHQIPNDQLPRGRGRDGYYEDDPRDRRGDRDDQVPLKVHPERARLLDLPPQRAPDVSRSSRESNHGRRPRDGDDDLPRGYSNGVEDYSDRPGMKRGGSLLDRLSLDTTPASSSHTTLRIEEIPGLPPKPVGVDDVDMNKGRGGRRRSGKPKRTRKGGA
ncbi:hypothetical protein BXZ70DRAFT_84256 [Cristinia sonorae]|uniref:Uncharacterized protein n=1 Tax=Cristinia sonorae TaxID=1940300 RepID=A0A8K0US10_9AGAR|nr:hypothetical protein BXZ70DRAFT_84256 [Cristinia sonorae]